MVIIMIETIKWYIIHVCSHVKVNKKGKMMVSAYHMSQLSYEVMLILSFFRLQMHAETTAKENTMIVITSKSKQN